MNQDFWKQKRVLVTGHTGFKGSWLCEWLSVLGADVCGYSLAPASEPNLFDSLDLASRVRSVIADISSLARLNEVFAEHRPEIVLHLAAQSLVRRSYREPVETYRTNVMGTVNVLEAIRQAGGVRSAVIVTTDKVYENQERAEPYIESDVLGGFDPYASSKACAEFVTTAYRRSFFDGSNTHVASARAGNVIGGGDWSEDRLLPDVFRSMIFGRELSIRNPRSIRPWQHVLEPLAGYLTLAERLYAGSEEFASSWNFGPLQADSQTVGSVLETISGFWDEELIWKADEAEHPHETGILRLDSTKAIQQLGWSPKLNIHGALRLTAEWYRDFRDGGDMIDVTRRQIEYYQGLNGIASA